MTDRFTREELPDKLVRIIPEEVQTFLRRFAVAGFDICLVGAGVRNLLTNRPIVDPDFTTNAKPEEIQKLFPDSFYDNVFGTVGIPQKVTSDGREHDEVFEVTTYRTEHGYSDKRRPDNVQWGKTLEEDLARRDFTINAMVVGIDANSKFPPPPRLRRVGKIQNYILSTHLREEKI